MNKMFAGRRRVSLEELTREPESEVVEDVVEIASRPSAEVMEAQADIADVADELSERQVEVSELVDAADTLEDYRQTLTASLDETGLDRAGAAVVQVGLTRTLARVGSDLSVPSLESYGSASNRIQSTRLTLEAIGEKIKEIWEGIKKALAAAWAAFKKFVVMIFDRIERVRDQAQKVMEAAGSATGTPKSPTIEVKGAGASLAVSGKVSDDWFNTVGTVFGAVETSLAQAKEVPALYTAVAGGLSAMNPTTENIDDSAAAKLLATYMSSIRQTALALAASGQKAPGLDVPGVDKAKADVTMSAVLPGNVVYYVTVPKGEQSFPESVANAKAGFTQLSQKTNAAASDTFKVLPVDSIKKAAVAIVNGCTNLKEMKGALEQVGDSGAKMIAAGDQLIGRASAANATDAAQAGVRAVCQALPRMVDNAGNWPKFMAGYVMSLGGATLKVCQASLAAYAAGTAPADAKALAAPAAPAAPAAEPAAAPAA